jgi:hypothetical protein
MEADTFLYNAMWKTYTDNVEKARKLPAGSIMQGINELPEQMKAAGDDSAKLALNLKLVDGLKTRDELRDLMLKNGARDEQGKTSVRSPLTIISLVRNHSYSVTRLALWWLPVKSAKAKHRGFYRWFVDIETDPQST